jgi:hypothetical protein
MQNQASRERDPVLGVTGGVRRKVADQAPEFLIVRPADLAWR